MFRVPSRWRGPHGGQRRGRINYLALLLVVLVVGALTSLLGSADTLTSYMGGEISQKREPSVILGTYIQFNLGRSCAGRHNHERVSFPDVHFISRMVCK